MNVLNLSVRLLKATVSRLNLPELLLFLKLSFNESSLVKYMHTNNHIYTITA